VRCPHGSRLRTRSIRAGGPCHRGVLQRQSVGVPPSTAAFRHTGSAFAPPPCGADALPRCDSNGAPVPRWRARSRCLCIARDGFGRAALLLLVPSERLPRADGDACSSRRAAALGASRRACLSAVCSSSARLNARSGSPLPPSRVAAREGLREASGALRTSRRAAPLLGADEPPDGVGRSRDAPSVSGRA